ncbi:MAG: DUF1320 family protein [Flavobacteriales bacterium]|nr:DUF1320 family protein [Flavobacteriales bacterium]
MYLLPEELNTVLRDDVRGMLSEFDSSLIEQIIAETEAIVRTYLGEIYDMDVEMAKTLTDRNYAILKHFKDIVIYEIFSRHTRQINEVVAMRYDYAMKWLEKVATGKISLPIDLVVIDQDAPDTDLFLSGGKQRYSNDF